MAKLLEYYLILHIRFSLCVKFHSEQTILDFWIKFAQEGNLLVKTEKVNIIFEFCIFELILVPTFSLKLDSHLPKKKVICSNESPLKMMKNAF